MMQPEEQRKDTILEQEKAIHDIEVELIVSLVHQHYGYDFSHYSRDSLLRRLQEFSDQQQFLHLSEMIPQLLWNQHLFTVFLEKMTIGVTEFFRDSDFFHAFKEQVIPSLSTFPYLKCWHAGCSTGEEAYSMAMLLDANNLLDKAIIYATDINNSALDVAKTGIYSEKSLKQTESKAHHLLGEQSLKNYYHASYGRAKISDYLLQNITFSHHNLVSDSCFGQMNVVCCRNVLIYFDHELQDRVFKLFSDSLLWRIFMFGKRGNLV